MAWDFAAEIHSLSNYNADDASTTGTSGEVLSAHATQWLTDGAKEIINQLPANLKTKCSTVSLLNNSATTMDLDTVGDILHVTRLSADSSGFQLSCRVIDAQYGGLAEDSTSLSYYGTATDPVYWIASNTSDAGTLFVKPDPTANQTCYVHHITYPTVAFDSTAIANFPDEAEYLVVLYASTKACLYQMNTLQTDTTIDTTALGAIATELNKADDLINTAQGKVGDFYTSIGDIDNTTELWDDTNKRFTVVRDALLHSQNLLSGNAPTGDYDVYGNLADIDTQIGAEDVEIASARIQQASTTLSAVSTELNRANVAISEINTIMASYSLELQGVPQYISTASGYISQAAGYVGEVNARIGRANQKYTWYDAQYAKLSAEYARGLAVLKGG